MLKVKVNIPIIERELHVSTPYEFLVFVNKRPYSIKCPMLVSAILEIYWNKQPILARGKSGVLPFYTINELNVEPEMVLT